MTLELKEIVIGVSDMQRSLAFYRELLELTTSAVDRQSAGGCVSLYSRNSRLVLDPQLPPAGSNAGRLVFETTNFEALLRRCIASGIVHDGQASRDTADGRAFTCRDPDGLAIDVFEYPVNRAYLAVAHLALP